MKIKTLVDLEHAFIPLKVLGREGYDSCWMIEMKTIKAEAIEWVKRWRGFKKIIAFDRGAIQSFTLFFNITEEDLKS